MQIVAERSDFESKVTEEGKSPEPALVSQSTEEYKLPSRDHFGENHQKLLDDFATLPKFYGEAELTAHKWA